MVSVDVVALALFPAVLWGFEPIVSKRGLNAGGRSLQAAVTAVLTTMLVYWVALLVLHGPRDAFAGLDAWAIGVFVAGGLTGTAVGRLGLFAGIRRVGASVTNAVLSSRPLFATTIALVWLGEPVGPLVGVGVVLLVVGLVLLTLSKGGDIRGWEPYELLFPLFAAVVFALGNVIRRFGLTTTDVTVLQAVTINETAAAFVLVGYVLARDRGAITEVPRETFRYFVVSGLITATALLSMFAALDRGVVAVVDSITALSPLFTAFFAYFLLRDIERITRGIVVGALLIAVGVTLIVGGGQLLAALA